MNDRQNIDYHIGGRLRLLRERLNLSEMELADRLAVDPSELLAYERGDRRIATPLLLELATILMVHITYFFVDDAVDPHKPNNSQERFSNQRVGAAEYSRLLVAFDAITSLHDRQMLVEFAEALTRGQPH